MPSGPKKRRAELRKKNDTISKTSSNPTSHTHDETLVAVVDQLDQKTIETPMMVDGSEHLKKTEEKGKEYESVDDKIIMADTNKKKTEANESDGVHDQLAMVNPPVIEDTVKDASLETHDLSFLDSPGAVDAIYSSEKLAMVKPDDLVCSKEPQDVLKELLKSNVDDPPVSVHQSPLDGLKSAEVSLVDQKDEVGEVIKLLEKLIGISAEIGFHAEKQVSLGKEFARLLEELKFGMLK